MTSSKNAIDTGRLQSRNLQADSPVVISGIGGSGTRVVASCVQELGLFMGHDLNSELDDWWFTYLFRRPLWYQSVYQKYPDEIATLIKLHRDLMIGESALDESQLQYAYAVKQHFLSYQVTGNRPWHYGKKWVQDRVYAVEHRQPITLTDYSGWGWKSPIAHIFLPELDQQYSNLRFIHLIRNGLDMAYSFNQKQAQCWSWLFDIEVGKRNSSLPKLSLEYWVRANQRVVEYCRRHLDQRHLIIRFEDLYARPAQEIQRIADFIGLEVAANTLHRLASIPRLPSTVDRYIKYGIEDFGDDLLHDVEQFGYKPSAVGLTEAKRNPFRKTFFRLAFLQQQNKRKLQRVKRKLKQMTRKAW